MRVYVCDYLLLHTRGRGVCYVCYLFPKSMFLNQIDVLPSVLPSVLPPVTLYLIIVFIVFFLCVFKLKHAVGQPFCLAFVCFMFVLILNKQLIAWYHHAHWH